MKAAQKRKYHRQRFKKQFTVRIDEELAKAVTVRAEGEGLRLTDAVEAGLWLWLQRRSDTEVVVRGRFLWNEIPKWLQDLTMNFWGYMAFQPPTESQKIIRDYVRKIIELHPDYAAAIQQLIRPTTA